MFLRLETVKIHCLATKGHSVFEARYAPPNISIQSVKRGIARLPAHTVLKVEDRTWRGKHQVRTPVHELGDSIAENNGEIKAIRQGRIANGMSKKISNSAQYFPPICEIQAYKCASSDFL